jgi:hypothetical protein
MKSELIIKATASLEEEIEKELKVADPKKEIAKAILENKNDTGRTTDGTEDC